MKQRNLTSLLFTFLLIILSISSCKKESDVQPISEKADRIKTVSVGTNGIATITTVNGSHYTQDVAIKSSKGMLSTSSISSNGDSTVVFTLPIPILGPKSGGGPTTNLLPGGGGDGGGTVFQPIIAYVTSVNGFVTVRLSSYSQTSNGTTQNVVVYGIVSYGDGGSFFVQYNRFGVNGPESFSIEYSFHF